MTHENFLLSGIAVPLRNYLEKQRAALRLASFVDIAALDDEKHVIDEFVKNKYPTMEASATNAVARFFTKTSGSMNVTASTNLGDIEIDIEAFMGLAQEFLEDDTTLTVVLNDAIERQARIPSAPVLYSSLLTNLVSGFEVLMGDLARAMLARYPNLTESKEKTFTWPQILEAGSIEDLRAQVIDGFVDKLMRGSIQDLLETYRSKFHLDIPASATPDHLMEVFLRRNIWVHNEGCASKEYLSKLPPSIPKPNINAEMPLDMDYLLKAADELFSLGFRVAWAIGCKFTKKKEWPEFEVYMVNTPYRLLQVERFNVVKNTTSADIRSAVSADSNRLILQVNHWLAHKKLGRFSECENEVREWQTDVLSPRFRIAKLALLDEHEDALELVKQVRGTDELPLVFWQTWPLLTELRSFERSLDDGAPEGGAIELSM